MTIQVLAGAQVQELAQQSPLSAFDPQIVAFCQALSSGLLKHQQAKLIPELAALGFWLRKANLQKMSSALPAPDGVLRKALGLVVHYTPANVDTMFVYSWICSLLMGNNNLVRLASQDSAAKFVLLDLLSHLFAQDEFSAIALRNSFVSYSKEAKDGAKISLMADARVIWGGDASVQTIRQLPCKPRCRDIPFADRYSMALVNGDAVTVQTADELALHLWRDTKPYAQMACSSPRVIFWLADNTHQALLIEKLNSLADTEPQMVSQLTNHLVTSQLLQAHGDCCAPVRLASITVVPVSIFHCALLDWHDGNGLFYLVAIDTLDQLHSILDEKCQTLCYWGLERGEMLRFISESPIKGIDRILPIGQALDFSQVWDGFDLFNLLSRHVSF